MCILFVMRRESFPKFEQSDIEILAKEYSWPVKIPSPDTLSYKRLHDTLLQFASLIESARGPRVDTNRSIRGEGNLGQAKTSDILGNIDRIEREIGPAEKRRRELHNELCVMIFGTNWDNTDPMHRQEITGLAYKVYENEHPPVMEGYAA